MGRKRVLEEGIEVKVNNSPNDGSNYDNSGDQYDELLKSVRGTFTKAVKGGKKLFKVYVAPQVLSGAYLDNIPKEAQQHYTCMECQLFIERFGNLVTISEKGVIKSAIWDDKTAPVFFKKSIKAMKDIVLACRVKKVFLSDVEDLGNAVTNGWSHLSVTLPSDMVYVSDKYTPHQAMSQKSEDFKSLVGGITEYSVDVLRQAVHLFETKSLEDSDKFVGWARFLLKLKEDRDATKNSILRDNITWLAVANAPVGYCSFRNASIGTLLDGLTEGRPFDALSRSFSKVVDPLKYQRSQVAPKAGNILEAEKLVEKKGAKRSFERRFARKDELKTEWTPNTGKSKANNPVSNGLFANVQAKNTKPVSRVDMETPAKTMSWRKFSEEVMPNAENIEILIESRSRNFSGILTALYADAPPILQWDSLEDRNPFSWYIYSEPTPCKKWGMTQGYAKVSAICLQPSMWKAGFDHQGKAVFFIVEGAKDNRGSANGNCLFPSILKSDYHEIRSTIEAFSQSAPMHGYEEASACGVRLSARNETWNTMLKVQSALGTAYYKLDRWD